MKRFCNNDYNLRRSVRYREIESLYLSLSGSGVPLILDLGANIGLSSLYFCKNWPLAKIVALEPERRNLETLLLNIKGIPSIDAIHAAISSHDGTVRITNPDDDAWGYRTQETAEGGAASIRAMSVDSVIETIDIKDRPLYPFIAKIDIEGFEENLFLKNTDWVRQFPVIAIELHDWMLPGEGSSRNFFKTIANGNWDVVFHGELALCISNDFRASV